METLFESNFESFEALFSERLVFKDGSICDFVSKQCFENAQCLMLPFSKTDFSANAALKDTTFDSESVFI